MKAKTKIITLEGMSEISNSELARRITEVLAFHLADNELEITQKVRVQVAQQAKE